MRGDFDVLAAHLVDVFIRLVAIAQGIPALDQIPVVRVQIAFLLLKGFLQAFDETVLVVQFRSCHSFHGALQLIQGVGHVGLLKHPIVITANALRNLAEVARSGRRNDVNLLTLRPFIRSDGRQFACTRFFHQGLHDGSEESIGPWVIKLGGHGAKHRHVLHGIVPTVVVALHLFFYVAQGIQGSALVKLVQGN